MHQSTGIETSQRSYATLLVWLVRVGLIVMGAGFLVYAAGWATAALPISSVPDFWNLDARTYAEATGFPTGWRWVEDLGDGAVLAFAGTLVFPLAATLAALGAAGFFARDRVRAYAGIAVSEAVLLCIAASGLLTGSGG